jgi:hypothetical protein
MSSARRMKGSEPMATAMSRASLLDILYKDLSVGCSWDAGRITRVPQSTKAGVRENIETIQGIENGPARAPAVGNSEAQR